MNIKSTVLISMAILLISGCTTTSILGLSRASYVDELEKTQADRIEELREKNREQESRIEEELKGIRNRDDSKLAEIQENVQLLQSEMEELQRLTAEVEKLTLMMRETGRDTAELQALAEQFKARMDTIYKDTLHVLVTALEQYIEEPEKL